MKVPLSSNEFIHGLLISYPTIKRWKDEGMPVIRQNPWLFNDKSLKWVVENKPDRAELAKKMMEVNNE